MRIHPKRAPVALVIALLALSTAAVGVLAACGGNDSTGSTTTSSAAPPPTTTTTQQSFVSDLYGYSVESWTGTSAQTAWDGTGSPGDGDPTVDSLSGPELQRAFAYAGPTKTRSRSSSPRAGRRTRSFAVARRSRRRRSPPPSTGSRQSSTNCIAGYHPEREHDSRRTGLRVLHLRPAGEGSGDAGLVPVARQGRFVQRA